jgi:glyoxylate/hydroxypyruvate reductase A
MGTALVKAPDIPFRPWPDIGEPESVRFLATWQPPDDLVRTLPNLEVIFSVGAGVDPFDLSGVPPHITVVRMIEPGIVEGMVEYVTQAVLTIHRYLEGVDCYSGIEALDAFLACTDILICLLPLTAAP